MFYREPRRDLIITRIISDFKSASLAAPLSPDREKILNLLINRAPSPKDFSLSFPFSSLFARLSLSRAHALALSLSCSLAGSFSLFFFFALPPRPRHRFRRAQSRVRLIVLF